MDKKLFLIDGHSLIFRMYYAFLRRPMLNSKGEDVSILYGFTKYVLELVDREKPTHIAVCFDPPGKTFRHEMYPEYKGTRQAAPELVIAALDPLAGICRALGYPVYMVSGFEGDDVLGTIAVRCAAEGYTVYMVTPDKDFGQLVNERIFQYKPGKAGGDNEILGVSELCAKTGICNPSQIVDMLAICGDTADNVPGVNGVGDVGAARLIARWGSLENIYAHIGELTPRQAELFNAARDHIALSKELVTIKTDVPVDLDEKAMELQAFHSPAAAELFARYEFPSLQKYIRLADGGTIAERTHLDKLEWREVLPEQLVSMAAAEGRCAIVVNAGGDDIFSSVKLVTAAVSINGVNYAAGGSAEDFSAMLSDGSVAKRGYNLKFADNLLCACGMKFAGKLEDVELMHYVIDPEKSHRLENLCRSYLNVSLDDGNAEEDSAAPAGLFDMLEDGGAENAPKPGFKEAVAVFLLADLLEKELASLSMNRLYSEIEEPLIRVLGKMERAGVKVELNRLRAYSDSLSAQLLAMEADIREKCGVPDLNVNSPRQVGEMLFGKLNIDPKMKMKKQSYPTDEETLSNYVNDFPIVGEILEYREVKKLVGTYIEPFGGWVSPRDGRIHTTFNQALTATGRLSSSRPNLQNIPIRTERGKEIRKAFVASSPDNVIVSADYSQIELRLMAHFCGDHNMRNAFCNGRDVHAITASKIFKLPLEEVTPQMRRTAKTANFGIMYGISAFGLAQRLRIPRVAAKRIIEDYFDSFPTILEWIEKTRENASRMGYVQTLFGRRRYLPGINSRNATVRSLAERNAVNAPIQGSAADIIKMAMNRVDMRLSNAAMRSRMVLQIHDELVFDAPRSELDELMDMIKNEMENVITLSVPLTVECNYGENWLEAH